MKEHEYEVFQEAVDYIRSHMAQPLQVADIAQAIHVSESRLQRSFRACADVGVHGYLLRCKLDFAMEHLRNGGSVEAVAQASGFCNRNHFSCCFKKRFGLSPSKVKRTTAEDA